MTVSQRVILLSLCWHACHGASSILTSFSVQVSIPSADPFQFTAHHQGQLLSCDMSPNTTSTWFTCNTPGGIDTTYDSSSDAITLDITHLGATTSTTLSISDITVTRLINATISATTSMSAFCSCLDDPYAVQDTTSCSDGLSKWSSVCMSNSYLSTCGLYSYPRMTLSLNTTTREATLDTSDAAHRRHECDAGYVDVTDGDTKDWACGEDCVGGQHLTDGVCNCACIRDTCRSDQDDGGLDEGAIAGIVIGVFLLLCCVASQWHKQRRRRTANAVQAGPASPVLGEGGQVCT